MTLVARHVLAAELGVATQTIAKWSRQSWGFPQPARVISDRLILYDRAKVDSALATRAAARRQRVLPKRA